jgi:uncharacterized protein YxjI
VVSSMPVEPAAPGWQRFIVKSKFGAGRDFAVTDTAGRQVLYVDGKLALRTKGEVRERDKSGPLRYNLHGRFFNFPHRMDILDPSRRKVALVKAKFFSPIRSKLTIVMAGGPDWASTGSLMEKRYTITAGGNPVIHVDQKWVQIRDSYKVDVIDGVDPALAVALVWGIDRLLEHD